MFENLIESKPKKNQTVGQMITSGIVHALVVFGAVKATAGAAEAIKERVIDTTMVFLKPPEPPPPPPDQPPPEAVMSANPPPQGFQTLVAPDQIPTEIPPVDLNQKALNVKDFSGKGIEGGIAAGVIGGTGPVGDVADAVFTAAELDDPVQAVNQPAPRYPPMLQSAGITGSVDVQFVVDTTGRVENGSFKVLKATHKAFEEPAREAILKSVFKPAKYRGGSVRQLVQQRLSFKIGG
ncbi:MAG: energy transducer TonB [Gemmatimonadales bacterium]|nr:energy transducer TonB [Gemmatimonadales bacterium]